MNKYKTNFIKPMTFTTNKKNIHNYINKLLLLKVTHQFSLYSFHNNNSKNIPLIALTIHLNNKNNH